MSSLGEYAMKAIAAGGAILKMRAFLKTEEQVLELSRAEVEGIMTTIREFIGMNKKLKETSQQYPFGREV